MEKIGADQFFAAAGLPQLSQYAAFTVLAKFQILVNGCVCRSHRKIRPLCNLTETGYSQEWLLWAVS